jgi:hypothetical protein
MKQLFFLLLISSFSNQLIAQGTIVSLSVNPPNPTEADEVEVYAEVSFPSGGCELDDQNFSLSGTSITASAHHCVGLLAVICNNTDTFSIGQLPAGNYTFDLTLTSGAGGPDCTPGIVPDDSDQFQFTVSSSVSVDEIKRLDGFVYPNPVKDVLNLKKSLTNTAMITDASGKCVADVPLGCKQFDLSHLPNGIYVLHIGNSKLKLVKVN